MLGREKEQILTRKQLFKGKGELFCFFLDCYSGSTNILFSQDFVTSGKKNPWYCFASSFSGWLVCCWFVVCVVLFCFFSHSLQRKCSDCYLLGRRFNLWLRDLQKSLKTFSVHPNALFILYNMKGKISNLHRRIQSTPDGCGLLSIRCSCSLLLWKCR